MPTASDFADPSRPVFITGGAGFIGSTLVRHWLAEESAPAVILDRLTYAGLSASLAEVAGNPRYCFVRGDVADASLLVRLFAEHRPGGVIHLAAETHVDRSIAGPPEFVRANVLGTCTLLDQATRYWQGLPADQQRRFRFLLASTDEVFGSAEGERVFRADDPLTPNSPYAASKAAAEHLAHAFRHTYGLPTLTVNPTNNYGPRQLPEKLIPRMILAAARRQPLPLYGDGLQERDWLHVDDCCRAIRAAYHGGAIGQRYLIGSGATLSNRAVVEQICDLADARLADGGNRRDLIVHVADRPGHDRRYAVDASPLSQLADWRTRVPFARGLQETVDWYLDHPEWVAAAEDSLARRDGVVA